MCSILFVDDDPEVISSTRRLLYSFHRDWQVQYAQSAMQAMETLNHRNVDVIVSDIRMPGIDGIQFLKTVKEKWPQTIRIVLSGHSNYDSSLQASGIVHQFLIKPCPIDEVIRTIEKSLIIENEVKDPQLRSLMGQLKTVPSQPLAYLQIIEELKNPEASAGTIGKIISRDLSMSAKILQLVNSAFFSLPQQIVDPAQAVVLLGVETVRDLVLAIGIFNQFDKVKMEHFGLNWLWPHSQRTSCFSRRIASDLGGSKDQTNEAFIAGLVHDIGKLVLADNLPDTYATILEMCKENQLPFDQAEMNVMGITHAQVGAYLLGLWGLPDPVVQAVLSHHNLPAESKCPLVSLVVHVSNVLDYQANPPIGLNYPPPQVVESCLKQFNLQSRLDGWVELVKIQE